MSGPGSRRRGWITVAGRLVLAFGLLGLAIYLNRSQLRDVLARPVDRARFAAAFTLYLGGLVLAFVRWWMLMRVLGLAVGCLATLRLGFIGLLFNLVIPGAIGGDVVKGALLFRLGVNRTQAVASIVVDRVLGLLGLFGLAAVVGLSAWGRLDPSARRLVVVAWVLLLAFATGLALAVRPNALSRPVANERRARRRADLAIAATAYRGRPAILALSLALALATHTLNVLAFRSASHALYPTVPTVAEHAVLVPLILFSTAVPLPLAALGLTEEVSAQLFRLVAFPGGAVAMMAFRLLQYGGAATGAALYLPDRRRTQTAIAQAEGDPLPA